MTFLWMLVASMVGLAAAVAAVALERAGHALGRSTQWPWVAAILFSTIWPAWLLARALASRSVRPPTSATILPPIMVTAGRSALTILTHHAPVFDSRVTAVLLGAWLVATAALLIRLCLGMWVIRRERRVWTHHDADGVAVLIANAAGPAVVGVREPAIVLPQWILTLDPKLRRMVLQHEQEHVRAGDAVLRLLGALLTALMPWNLALWIQADRLALAIEVDCDARVLAGDTPHERYGLLLLAIAQRQSSTMLAPALSEGRSHLERRISVMRRNLPKHPALVAGGCVTAASIALVVACSAPTPSAPPSALAQQSASGATIGSVLQRSNAAPTGVYFDFQVEKQASPSPGSATPRYPDTLQTAGITGEVIAQFVIDTSGQVEMNTFKVIKSDNDLFTDAVKAVLPKDRFYPAEVGGRHVKELVQEPYVFNMKP